MIVLSVVVHEAVKKLAESERRWVAPLEKE